MLSDLQAKVSSLGKIFQLHPSPLVPSTSSKQELHRPHLHHHSHLLHPVPICVLSNDDSRPSMSPSTDQPLLSGGDHAGLITHSEGYLGVPFGQAADLVHVQVFVVVRGDNNQGLVTNLRVLEIISRLVCPVLWSTCPGHHPVAINSNHCLTSHWAGRWGPWGSNKPLLHCLLR